MKRRLWCILLTACMVLTLLPFSAFAIDFPSDSVDLPIDGKAYAADGWYRFAPTEDGVYTFTTGDAQADLSIYRTRLAPAEFIYAEQWIAEGERQLNEGKAAVQEGDMNYAAGKATFDEAAARYAQKLAQHERARAEYERNLALVNIPIIGEAAREMVAAFEKEEADLEWTAALLQADEEELARAEQMLKDAHRQIAEGEVRLQAAKDHLAASKAGKSSEPTSLFSNEYELRRKGLFFGHAGSEYLIYVHTLGDPSLSCQLVCKAFKDVADGDYYFNPVYWAAANKITLGTDGTHFSPDAPCTRAQVVTFLWRYFGCPKTNSSTPFRDVSSDAYYYDAVRWAVEQGITNGTDETHFCPDAPCTRAQVVTFLWRANGEESASSYHMFSDVPSDAYFFHAVIWAISKGVTNGTDYDHFSPEDTCTRAQFVTFLYRASQ